MMVSLLHVFFLLSVKLGQQSPNVRPTCRARYYRRAMIGEVKLYDYEGRVTSAPFCSTHHRIPTRASPGCTVFVRMQAIGQAQSKAIPDMGLRPSKVLAATIVRLMASVVPHLRHHAHVFHAHLLQVLQGVCHPYWPERSSPCFRS